MKILTQKNQSSGFTLIELLVVVAIISLLSSIVFTSLNSVRAKARDTKRISDLKQLQTALALYYDSNNSLYPTTGGAWWGIPSTYNLGGTKTTSGPTGYIPNLAPQYISVLPSESTSSTFQGYLYNSNGSDYILLAHQTIESFDPDTGPHPLDRVCCNEQSLSIYTSTSYLPGNY